MISIVTVIAIYIDNPQPSEFVITNYLGLPGLLFFPAWVVLTIFIVFTKNESFIPSRESLLKYETPAGQTRMMVTFALD